MFTKVPTPQSIWEIKYYENYNFEEIEYIFQIFGNKQWQKDLIIERLYMKNEKDILSARQLKTRQKRECISFDNIFSEQ